MSTVDDVYDRLLQAKRKPDEKDYGGNVLPAARVYSSLRTHEEVRAFDNALRRMLSSDDEDLRDWAVNVCVGFVAFRDAIEWPKLERATQ